jgi:hypothetical protein
VIGVLPNVQTDYDDAAGFQFQPWPDVGPISHYRGGARRRHGTTARRARTARHGRAQRDSASIRRVGGKLDSRQNVRARLHNMPSCQPIAIGSATAITPSTIRLVKNVSGN